MTAAMGRPTPRPIFAPRDRPPLLLDSFGEELSELSVGDDDADVSPPADASVEELESSVLIENMALASVVNVVTSTVALVRDSLSSVVSDSWLVVDDLLVREVVEEVD
jgi:hypothetical protein